MANLIRKNCFGLGAETLANAGKNYLNYIERMPRLFADPMLDGVYRDTLSRRRIVGADGSVLQVRRGPISRVVATVPSVPSGVEERVITPYGIFIALDIYSDTGATKIGTLLVDYYTMEVSAYHPSVMPSSPYFATGDTYGAEFVLGTGHYKEAMGAFTSATDWVSAITGSSTVRDDPSYYRKLVTGTSKIGNALAAAVSDEYQIVDDTSLVFSASIDISGEGPTTTQFHAVFDPSLNYDSYVDDKGFNTKNVLVNSPFTVTPRYIKWATGPRTMIGDTVATAENFGWISDSDYAFVIRRTSRSYSSNVNFNSSTRTLEWFTDSGASNGIYPVPGKTYYSDTHYLGLWESGHSLAQLDPFFPEMNIIDIATETYSIHHNGAVYDLETIDTAAGESITSHMINYYHYPIGETTVIYAYTKITASGSQFNLVAIKNGVLWKRSYDYDGSLIHFSDSNIRFCYGDIRMIVFA